MKKAKQPGWMSDEAWQRHQEHIAAFNAQLLELLRSELAEARADRNDPDLTRHHESRILVLQCQINDVEGTASYQQEPSRPVVVRADKPPRSRRKSSMPASQPRRLADVVLFLVSMVAHSVGKRVDKSLTIEYTALAAIVND